MTEGNTNLRIQLADLGLAEYYDRFVAEGFTDWASISDIQESDLESLGVKLGHRRILNREIATQKGFPQTERLEEFHKQNTSSTSVSHVQSTTSQYASDSGSDAGASPNIRSTSLPQKRKYKRHPKADDNAPAKPPSAYVIFSNKIREDEKDANLSFTQLARLVGERWKNLHPAEKEAIEAQAAEGKRRYTTEVTLYKTTPEYHLYQAYRKEFNERLLRDERPEKLEPPRKLQRNVDLERPPDSSHFASKASIPVDSRYHPYWHPPRDGDRHEQSNSRITITSILQNDPHRAQEHRSLPSVDHLFRYGSHTQSPQDGSTSTSVRSQAMYDGPRSPVATLPAIAMPQYRQDSDTERSPKRHDKQKHQYYR